VPRFKLKLLATLVGWKVRRVLAVLNTDTEVREAIDVIKMYEDTKTQGENLFFKQLKEKFPTMIELFHNKLNELMESTQWLEKPVVKKKVLVGLSFSILDKQKCAQIKKI